MNFVFIAMEAGKTKRLVVQRLLVRKIPFVDVGMGVYLAGDTIGGTLRVATATATKHDHLAERMPFSDDSIKNEYDKNIQIADLNAINAGLPSCAGRSCSVSTSTKPTSITAPSQLAGTIPTTRTRNELARTGYLRVCRVHAF